MKLCDYGCGQEAKYQFKNGKWCCEDHWRKCPNQRKKNSTQMKKAWKDPTSGLNSISCKEKKSDSMKKMRKDANSVYNSDLYKKKQSKSMKDAWRDLNSELNSPLFKEKISNSMKKLWDDYSSIYNLHGEKIKKLRDDPNSTYNSIEYKEKHSNSMKETWKDPNSGLNSSLCKEKQSVAMKIAWKDPTTKLPKFVIGRVKEQYPFFSKIEEMRYNPVKPEEKEIQVHCKNHNCKNSKEKGGWFTPTKHQLQNRKNSLENEGLDNSYFYCSQYCKDSCSLYGLHDDPYKVKDNNNPYTSAELDTLNKLVLKRDTEICYYCGEHATIVHHTRPKKLEPFFALDPDYAISVCAKCHYKYGHPTGSPHSTGNLAKIVCSVESQKFLEQNYK